MFTKGFQKTAAMAMKMPMPPRYNQNVPIKGAFRTARSPIRSTKPGGIVQKTGQNMTHQLGGAI
jgi:hypothetical protein